MATKIYFRRGTKAELDAIILDAGEPGWTTDTDELYMGDGVTSGGIFIAGGVGGVDTLNALVGAVTVSGVGTVTVTEDGQNIVISGAAGEFTDHSDTPSDYSGSAKQIVVVNAGESGVEFSKTFNVVSDLTSDEDYSGMVCSGLAGETLVFAESVYFDSSGKWSRTIATVEGQTRGHIGLVTVSGAADGNIEVLLAGFIRDDDWVWATIGAELWLDTTSGALSDTAPAASGEFVRKVAVTHGANIVWFNPAMSSVSPVT